MELDELLNTREFLNLATADRRGRPNAAPKFLLKSEKRVVYLIDYSYGRTIDNLRVNANASLCFMDLYNLQGYRLNGRVELLESGRDFDRLSAEVASRVVKLSADRVLEGMRTGKKHDHFELEIPDKFVVLKFVIEEVSKIGTRGDFYRESLGRRTPLKRRGRTIR